MLNMFKGNNTITLKELKYGRSFSLWIQNLFIMDHNLDWCDSCDWLDTILAVLNIQLYLSNKRWV